MTFHSRDSLPLFHAEQIAFLSEALKKEIKDWSLHACYGEDDQFTLLFKKGEQEKRVFFSLKKPFLRFYLTRFHKSNRSSQQEHPFNRFLEAQLVDIKAIEGDRILELEMILGRDLFTIIFEFFHNHPNYYFLDDKKRVLYSLHPSKSEIYLFPLSYKTQGQKSKSLLTHDEIEEFYTQFEKQIVFENEKADLHKHLSQAIKRLVKKQQILEDQLKDCLKWQSFQHEGELLKSHFAELKKGQSSIVVWDWSLEKEVTIFLDSSKTPQEQIADRFRKSKKLYKGIEFAKEQKEKIETELVSLKQKLKLLSEAQSFSVLSDLKIDKPLPFHQEKKLKEEKKSKPYFEYESAAGVKIWVGKSAAANEKLTFTLSKGLDWWLHAKDFAGSHVIIKNLNGKEPDPETLADAMQIALHYSKAKNEKSAEICLTQCKFLSKMGRGTTGKVQVSKHRILTVKMDKERFRRLKEGN